jgi:large subunit ribosomal protein L4
MTKTVTEKNQLPTKIFGLKPNEALMTQAVLVYLGNQRTARAKAKTRAEVNLTKAKMFRQKGTGRARHGSQSAPIFVGGGKAHGPTGNQNYKGSMTKKMISQAILNALSLKAANKEIVVLNKINEIKKTQEMAKLLLPDRSKKLDVLILGSKMDKAVQFSRNLKNLELLYVNNLNVHTILKAGKIFICEEAIKEMEEKWLKA